MKLYDIFKSLPSDMIFKSHIDGTEHMADEWAELLKKDPSSDAIVRDVKHNYGEYSIKMIFFKGVGPAFRECKYK